MEKKNNNKKEITVTVLANSKVSVSADFVTKEIKKNLNKVGTAQLNIAFLLKTVYDNELYRELEYQNVYDYANNEFGIARGTTSNWLMVASNYGIKNGDTGFFELDRRLKKFSITQLILMRSLTVEQIEAHGIKADMSCREIKEKVKALNQPLTSDNSNILVSKENVGLENEEDEESEGLYADCEKISEIKEQRAKLSFTVKGGTTIMESHIAIINDMIRKNPNNVFDIKVFVKCD